MCRDIFLIIGKQQRRPRCGEEKSKYNISTSQEILNHFPSSPFTPPNMLPIVIKYDLTSPQNTGFNGGYYLGHSHHPRPLLLSQSMNINKCPHIIFPKKAGDHRKRVSRGRQKTTAENKQAQLPMANVDTPSLFEWMAVAI